MATRDWPAARSSSSVGWAGHRIDIYEAVRLGLAKSLGQEDGAFVSQLRAGCDDEETWLQEYCCEFLSDAANYLPIELIMGCVSEQASTEWVATDLSVGTTDLSVLRSRVRPFGRRAVGTADLSVGTSPRHEGRAVVTGDLYLGVDIGRKRDLTIAWLFEKVGDVLWSRVLKVMSRTTFDVQERAICDLIEGGARASGPHAGGTPALRRCAIDQSGLGMMLAERLAKKYPGIVEPVQFTAQVKERLAPMVKQAFEDRTVRIPDNRDVRADLNAVKRFVTPAGNVRFDAEHTDKGHADRFWALALALNAASAPKANFARDAQLVGSPVVGENFLTVEL